MGVYECVLHVKGGHGSVAAGRRHGRARAGHGRHGRRHGGPPAAPRARPEAAAPDQADAASSTGATPLCTASEYWPLFINSLNINSATAHKQLFSWVDLHSKDYARDAWASYYSNKLAFLIAHTFFRPSSRSLAYLLMNISKFRQPKATRFVTCISIAYHFSF